jgi:hypothetical protein
VLTRFLFIQAPADKAHRYWANDGRALCQVENFGDTPLTKDRPVVGEFWKLERIDDQDMPIFAVSITDYPKKPWQK